MDVRILGTATGTGWPDPFCVCATCAALRSAGERRMPAAALVGETLLLDPTPASVRGSGLDLSGVRAVLLTSARPVHGVPPSVPSMAPGDVFPGWRRSVAGHDVRVLAAGPHAAGGAVAYDVTGPDGVRFLYAPGGTDQGPAPSRAYDLVLLGADLAATLADLRRAGAVGADTEVIAVGLDHADPPAAELAGRLASWGARAVPDGTLVTVPAGSSPVVRPVPSGGRRVLVLGGARSGKSAEAERRLAAEPQVTYLATGGAREGDEEWAARVDVHRQRRPRSWTTTESLEVAKLVRDSEHPLLVDCLSLWLAGVLDRHDVWRSGDLGPVHDEIDDLVGAWRAVTGRVVAVSNEVGSGVVPTTASGRLYRDELGRLNARIAAESDEVLLLVAGQILQLKGARR